MFDALPDLFEELAERDPSDRFPAEARRAARTYLAARRTLMWTPAVFVALLLASGLTSPSWLSSITFGLAFPPAVAAGVAGGVLVSTARWLRSLRRIAGYSPVAADVSLARYARAVLAGELVAGVLEAALLAVWNDRDEDGIARVELRGRRVSNVRGWLYDAVVDAPFPTWHLYGRPAWEAPLPDGEHTCTGWSVALIGYGTEKATILQGCACGAINLHAHAQDIWKYRNSRCQQQGNPAKQ